MFCFLSLVMLAVLFYLLYSRYIRKCESSCYQTFQEQIEHYDIVKKTGDNTYIIVKCFYDRAKGLFTPLTDIRTN